MWQGVNPILNPETAGPGHIKPNFFFMLFFNKRIISNGEIIKQHTGRIQVFRNKCHTKQDGRYDIKILSMIIKNRKNITVMEECTGKYAVKFFYSFWQAF